MNVTVAMVDGSSKRINLPAAAWSDRQGIELGTGIWLRAVYVGARSRRVVEETYSQWVRGNTQETVGTQYAECDAERVAKLAALLPDIEEALDGVIEVQDL